MDKLRSCGRVRPVSLPCSIPKRTRDFLTGRQVRHGSNALIMLVAFVLILVVVNAIVYQNPIQWDWTEDKQNTLAPETIAEH